MFRSSINILLEGNCVFSVANSFCSIFITSIADEHDLVLGTWFHVLTASFFFFVFCLSPRVGKQRLREARIQAVDYLILLLAGICLGTLAKVNDETFGSTGYLYTVIAVCKFIKLELSVL